MSGPLINRSLTTIRTELEFLYDSEVITEGLYNKLLQSLPPKYQKDSAPWGVEKLGVSAEPASYAAPPNAPPSATEKLADDFAKASITNNVPPPSQPPRSLTPKPVGYCKALYDYAGTEADDISLSKGDKIAVVEHLSEDWWKGYKKGGSPEKPGVFPSNYVNVISEQEFSQDASSRSAVAPPRQEEKSQYAPSPQSYSPGPGYQQSPPQYNQPIQQPMQQQPSYGGYAQYPPPSTNYYPPQQAQQQVYAQPQPAVVEQQAEQPSHLKKFGSKFGNAAIFGAGATLGGDLVNSIF